ncbi:hypothetical protein Sala_0063 [Sphingopyxis alaskensis RB2256]|uniref:Uncharacterized protein n=1 Tax=Sphingopyxis alaskensis (strain DSM 13593 / LMG 18877 / RB2256) TaxID=317655 RepID=Q1GX33_SPHAL|nr:hypothetical protein Sala_0063 [Sphingopyxis alaskensis RB2256]
MHSVTSGGKTIGIGEHRSAASRMGGEVSKKAPRRARPFRSLRFQSKRKPHLSPGSRILETSGIARSLPIASELLFDGFLGGVADVLRGIAYLLRRLRDRACFGLFVPEKLEAEEGRDSERNDDDERYAPSASRFTPHDRCRVRSPVGFADRMNFISHAILHPLLSPKDAFGG